MNNWLGLIIGNSRLHWGLFKDQNLIQSGDSQHLSCKSDRDCLIAQITDGTSPSLKEQDRILTSSEEAPLMLSGERVTNSQSLNNLTIYLASVVPQQTDLWLDYAQLQLITLQDIPLDNLYSTLGIDRALAVYGAGNTYGYPCLVIDGGTALTFTGVNSQQKLVGGAIVPGLRSQLTSLNQKTAALPEISLPVNLPKRWALNTQNAIASGIIYTAIASIVSFINDWCEQFPHSQVILTGGDGELLYRYLHNQKQLLTFSIIIDHHLILWGMRSIIIKH